MQHRWRSGLGGWRIYHGHFIPASKEKARIDVAANANYIQTIQITIAIVAIIIFMALTLAGLKLSAKTQNVLTVIKITLILLLIAPLFLQTTIQQYIIKSASSPIFKEYIKAFGIGLVAVSFTYGGYQQTINFGAEVDKPSKTYPWYFLWYRHHRHNLIPFTINYAYIKVIGFDTLHQPETKTLRHHGF